MPLFVEDPDQIRDQRVLVVEDGPTVTHGEMSYGYGVIAARRYGAREIVDPRPFVVDTIAETFEQYPNIGNLVPAMGYSEKQIQDLEKTINHAEVDLVLAATPIDLTRLITVEAPVLRVRYELQEIGKPDLADLLRASLG